MKHAGGQKADDGPHERPLMAMLAVAHTGSGNCRDNARDSLPIAEGDGSTQGSIWNKETDISHKNNRKRTNQTGMPRLTMLIIFFRQLAYRNAVRLIQDFHFGQDAAATHFHHFFMDFLNDL